jgi:hypothetical protein
MQPAKVTNTIVVAVLNARAGPQGPFAIASVIHTFADPRKIVEREPRIKNDSLNSIFWY